MSRKHPLRQFLRLRKNGHENLYLMRDGTWTPNWHAAAKFCSVAALERFAKKHNIDTYVIF
jgi:hypothetical protein